MRDPNRSALSAHRMVNAESVKDAISRRGRNIMARNRTSLEAAHASVKELIAEKLKYLHFPGQLYRSDRIRGFRQRPDGHEDRRLGQSGLRADRAQLSAVMGTRDCVRAHCRRQVRSACREGRDGDLWAGTLR